MSYVKALVIHKGEAHVVEVHGSQLMLDPSKDWDYEAGKQRKLPRFSSGEAYRKWCHENNEILSGTKEERFEKGLIGLKTDEQKAKFLDYLKEFDIRDWADSNRDGYRYNSAIDLDNEVFVSMENNWYANYERHLPDGWKYREVPADAMNSIYYDHFREGEEYKTILEGGEPPRCDECGKVAYSRTGVHNREGKFCFKCADKLVKAGQT